MENIRQTRSAALRSGMILTVLLFPTLIFQPLHAQESRATLEGRVTDQQGASIPGATVIVNSEPTGVNQQTVAVDPSQQNQPRVLQLAIKINF